MGLKPNQEWQEPEQAAEASVLADPEPKPEPELDPDPDQDPDPDPWREAHEELASQHRSEGAADTSETPEADQGS